jgi:hypothetical protein
VLAIVPGNTFSGLAGIAVFAAICAGYGYLLVGRISRRYTADPVELAGIALLTGFTALSWIGSILAAASLFTWWAVAVLAALLGWVARSRPGPLQTASPGVSSAPYILAVVALLAAASWLFARPAQTFLVFDDSAVYTIAGIHLANHGTLIPDVTPYACGGDDILRYWGQFKYWYGCANGISVGFLPLPKVWTAYAAWLYGDGAAVWSAPFVSTLGVFSLLLFLRRALGRAIALLAPFLTMISLPVMWFSRMVMSEPYVMVALFSGMFLLGLERDTNDSERPGSLGAVSALLLALLFLTRFEAGLIAGFTVAAWFIAQHRSILPTLGTPVLGWKGRWLVWVIAASFLALGLSFGVAPHYYIEQLTAVLTRNGLQVAILSVLLLGIVYIIGRQQRAFRQAASAVLHWPVARFLLIAGTLLLVVLFMVTLVTMSTSARGVAQWIILYLGLPVSILGLLGMLLLATERRTPEIYAMLTLAVIACAGYVARPLVNPVHPWAMRRFVPFIIPMLVTGAVWAFQYLWNKAHPAIERTRLAQIALLAGLSFALAFSTVPLVQISAPFVSYTETAGLWEQLVALDSLYPENAVLIFDDGAIGRRIPQVMELVLDRGVISLARPLEGERASRLDETMDEVISEGGRVFFNAIDGNQSWASERFGLVSAGSLEVTAPRVQYMRPPPPRASNIGTMRFLVDIFEVVPIAEARLPMTEKYVVPIGEGSFPHLVQGFYGLEYDPAGQPFRWTRGEARIVVALPEDLPATAEVDVWLDLAGWRPESAGEPEVTIHVQGQPVMSTQLVQVFAPQQLHVSVPAEAVNGQQQLEIELASSTWIPTDYGMSDTRTLGVIYYGATVKVRVPVDN